MGGSFKREPNGMLNMLTAGWKWNWRQGEGKVKNACNPSTLEAETGQKWIPGQSVLHSEFEACLGYIARPFLKKHK
jgi:hypothetical protein